MECEREEEDVPETEDEIDELQHECDSMPYITKRGYDGRLSLSVDRKVLLMTPESKGAVVRILARSSHLHGSSGLRFYLAARLIADCGLHFVDRTVYQHSFTMSFSEATSNGDSIFRIVEQAPWLPLNFTPSVTDDAVNLALEMHMPTDIPDSLGLTPLNRQALGSLNYGLTWYVGAALVRASGHSDRPSKVFHSLLCMRPTLPVPLKAPIWNESTQQGGSTELHLEAKLTSNRGSFVVPHPGTVGTVNISWGGNDSHRVQGIRVKGKQTVEISFHNHNGSDRMQTVKLKSTWLDCKLMPTPGHHEVNCDFELQAQQGAYQMALLPAGLTPREDTRSWLAPSTDQHPNNGRVQHVSVQYYIKVTAEMPWLQRDIQLHLPFSIQFYPSNETATLYRQASTELLTLNTQQVQERREEGAFESPFEPLPWMEDLQQARHLMAAKYATDVRDMQTCAKTANRDEPDKLWQHMQTMHSDLAMAQRQLSLLLHTSRAKDTRTATTAARDIAFLVMDALYNQALATFFNGQLAMAQREQAIHHAMGLYDWLELLFGEDGDEPGLLNVQNSDKLEELILPQLAHRICSVYMCMPIVSEVMRRIYGLDDGRQKQVFESNQQKLLDILHANVFRRERSFSVPTLLTFIHAVEDVAQQATFLQALLQL